MDEELLAQLGELRRATNRIKETMNAFATVGSQWVEAIDTMLRRQDVAGLVRFYFERNDPPYGLDRPFLWELKVELASGAVVLYGELFRRLRRLVDELGMMGASA